ncbi:hypothetical protein [Hyphobacterium sp.]|uniref:hypothetical protein n=1 Tax=Hyphobacterium sp. TaxID=2004662 RepID=UPI003749AE70
MQALRSAIEPFDGRSITLLGEAEKRFGEDPAYIDALIDLLADDAAMIPSGASWLLKSALERGETLTPPQSTRLARAAVRLSEWSASLHILQSLSHWQVMDEDADALAGWAGQCMKSPRPFVRAWAMDALCRIAGQFARFSDRAKAAHAAGLDDKAASVRARARRITPPE